MKAAMCAYDHAHEHKSGERYEGQWEEVCHQNLSEMEHPPALSRQLWPKVVKVGIRGMICAMGDSQIISVSGCNFSRKNSISWHILLLILYWKHA